MSDKERQCCDKHTWPFEDCFVCDIERLTTERDSARRCHREAEKAVTRLGERIAKLEAELALLKKMPMYVKSCPDTESRCVACDCTEEHQLHDPYCPVAAYHSLQDNEL